ncbi:MAG: hypothetical protein KBH81_03810 [Phycisphaerae bacterium]|nr:hypothetical protein [Phycisphaerae bacterium]HOO17390.1 hypothetical protein [Phycisphaerae bacterium]HPC21557.1 hypothetical protein [Phycisphaerae bacterium]HRS26889.1 hypothetical protein [Phycisphaerae bacterium]HRT41489.1 hypothetical protein [Phycisphaerae bacterium]
MKIAGQLGRTIEPGATEEIQVTVPAQTGDINRKIRVQTNDPNNANVELTCKGKILVPFRTDPATINFGKIGRDSGPVTKTVNLTRGDGGPLNPKIGKMDSSLSAELREIEPGEKYALDITVSPPWPNDKLRGSVTIETGLEEAPTETVRLFGQVDPRLKTEPKSFVLPADPPEDLDLRVALVWDGPPGKAIGATATDQTLKAELIEEDGKQFVSLHVPAHYQRKQKMALSVNVTTDDPAVSSLRIPISATGAAADKEIAQPARLAPVAKPGNAATPGPELQQPASRPAHLQAPSH